MHINPIKIYLWSQWSPGFSLFLAKFTENPKKCEIFCHLAIFGRFITIFHKNLSNSIFLYFVADYVVVYWKIKFLHSWQSYNGHNESVLHKVWKNCHRKIAIFCNFLVQMTPKHDNNAHQTLKTYDFLKDNLVRVRKNISQILKNFHTRL